MWSWQTRRYSSCALRTHLGWRGIRTVIAAVRPVKALGDSASVPATAGAFHEPVATWRRTGHGRWRR